MARARTFATLGSLLAGIVAVGFGAVTARAGESPTDTRALAYVDAVARTLDPRVATTLARIDGTPRRLLALRAYLRSGAHFAERWSWTQDQVDAYLRSAEHGELLAEIERVRAEFEAANPGYELWVNPEVRTLDVQLERWNENATVGAVGASLLAGLQSWLASQDVPSVPTRRSREEFERRLAEAVPSLPVPLAAPGLSPHGQMRAVDFQVHRQGTVVAGPSTATVEAVWDDAGWAAKLDAAVRRASCRFVGPLAAPREPWHYTYTPTAVATLGPDGRTVRCSSG